MGDKGRTFLQVFLILFGVVLLLVGLCAARLMWGSHG